MCDSELLVVTFKLYAGSLPDGEVLAICVTSTRTTCDKSCDECLYSGYPLNTTLLRTKAHIKTDGHKPIGRSVVLVFIHLNYVGEPAVFRAIENYHRYIIFTTCLRCGFA